MSFFGMFIQFVIILLFTVIWGFQWSELPAEQFQFAVLFALSGILVLAWRMSNPKPFTAQVLEKNRQLLAWLLNSVAAFIIGLIVVFAQAFFINLIPNNYYDRHLLVSGQIVEPVNLLSSEHSSNRVRIQLTLKVDAIEPMTKKTSHYSSQGVDYYFIKPKLKLSWYLSETQVSQLKQLPKMGESWRFIAKLKQNHAVMNLGGRDYERWLLQHGISAKGYISGLQYSPQQLPSASRLEPQALLDPDS